jgi:hypothetical protein
MSLKSIAWLICEKWLTSFVRSLVNAHLFSLMYNNTHNLDVIVISSLQQRSVFMAYVFVTCWVQAPEVAGIFFGIITRLILHRGFVQRLVSPYAVDLSVRNHFEIY